MFIIIAENYVRNENFVIAENCISALCFVIAENYMLIFRYQYQLYASTLFLYG